MTDPLDPSVVVAAALPRSGSTWVQRIIHESSDVFVWGESKMMYQLAPLSAHMRAWEAGVGGREREAFLRAGQDPRVWVANASPSYDAYRDALRAFFRTYYAERHGKRRYGWKEIKYRRAELELLWELFPELRFVLLVRHPADTLRSMQGAAREGVRLWFASAADAARAWAETAAEYAELAADPRVLLLRYEDVAARVAELCAFVGGDAARAKRSLAARVGAGRAAAELTPDERRCVSERCGAVMRRFDYVVDSGGPAGV